MMMISNSFKKMRDTWESDMRVGVVEKESLEEDIEVVKTGKFTFDQDHCYQDSSGFCEPVTNMLVPAVKIISKDSHIPA